MAKYYVQLGEDELGFEVAHTQEGTVLRPLDGDTGDEDGGIPVDFAPVHSLPNTGEGLYSILVRNKSYQLHVERAEEGYRMVVWRHRFQARVLTEREWRLQKVAPRQVAQSGPMVVKAPMPGLVKGVYVAEGDTVKAGQRLVVLVAMKMENDINAPRDGRVSKVHVEADTVVEGGKPLVTFE